MKWTFKRDNRDTYWIITDGVKFFTCDIARDAQWLCDILNKEETK